MCIIITRFCQKSVQFAHTVTVITIRLITISTQFCPNACNYIILCLNCMWFSQNVVENLSNLSKNVLKICTFCTMVCQNLNNLHKILSTVCTISIKICRKDVRFWRHFVNKVKNLRKIVLEVRIYSRFVGIVFSVWIICQTCV